MEAPVPSRMKWPAEDSAAFFFEQRCLLEMSFLDVFFSFGFNSFVFVLFFDVSARIFSGQGNFQASFS